MKKGFAFIDIKTTGIKPVLDKICYISVTTFNLQMEPQQSYSTWIDPMIPLKPSVLKRLNTTLKELREYPTFDDVAKTVYGMLSDRRLGTFNTEYDVIGFLQESFFDVDLKFNYPKKDFIIITSMEEYLYDRSLDTLYFKYKGQRVPINSHKTKIMGDVYKFQCEVINETPMDFKYSKEIKNNIADLTGKYLYNVKEDVYINFGIHKDKLIQDLPVSYLQWMMNSDFPRTVKDIIKEYIK